MLFDLGVYYYSSWPKVQTAYGPVLGKRLLFAARAFYEEAGSADKQLILYEDAAHMLWLDSSRNVQRSIADLTKWLDKRYA